MGDLPGTWSSPCCCTLWSARSFSRWAAFISCPGRERGEVWRHTHYSRQGSGCQNLQSCLICHIFIKYEIIIKRFLLFCCCKNTLSISKKVLKIVVVSIEQKPVLVFDSCELVMQVWLFLSNKVNVIVAQPELYCRWRWRALLELIAR